MSENPSDWQEDDDWISKSQLKREAQELKTLGIEICGLTAEQLSTIPISESMVDAVALAKRIRNKHEALRRHMNYIGKLMRTEDIDAIEAAMDKIRNRHLYETQQQHKLESIRDGLLQAEDSEAKIQQLLEDNPTLERQKLRQLVRQAKKELQSQKPARSYRELFRYLRDNEIEAE